MHRSGGTIIDGKIEAQTTSPQIAWDVSPVMLLAFIGVAAVVGFLRGLLVPRLQFSKSVLVLGF